MTVGVSDLVIIDTEDATLVCQKNVMNEIEKVNGNLKICNKMSICKREEIKRGLEQWEKLISRRKKYILIY
ncbi:MAG: hypothetical protein J6K15_00375 [Lachnospiraceae bacterium]|nr:hypothetical protein [Lachnospiraceae bacterium]